MPALEDADRLAAALGISDHYLDQGGARVDISRDTRRALAHALGFPENETAHAWDRLSRLKGSPLPRWRVLAADTPGTIETGTQLIRSPWRLEGEGRNFFLEGRAARNIDLPALPVGYYRLHAGAQTCFLIVAPEKCWLPDTFADGATRGWGLAVQAYGLRSHRNAGFGDFLDVAILASVLAQKGASFLGLSPLHALFTSDRSKISPYSPSSRLFLEPLYLALDVMGCEDEAQASAMRDAPLVDYRAAWAHKRVCLEKLFAQREAHAFSQAHLEQRARWGEAIELHATFEALSEHFSAQGLHWSGVWPSAYVDSASPDVAEFAREHHERVDFFVWLQLLAQEQASAAARTAQASGMELGLYRDLAVGADRYGSEVWSRPERYALDLSVGAPPDPLGPQGQSWGFPPFTPITLQEQDFVAFRDLLGANMRDAGAIRIDHAFQLQRLFLVPQGLSAAQGGYVDFPMDALLAILRVESHRHGCMVIAEDLGTGPPGFSERIMRENILSSRLLSFERGEGGSFRAPKDYPRGALAAITTHDLPTFKGWRRGFDIDLRACFGVFTEADARREHHARAHDLARWHEALAAEGLDGQAQDDLAARNEALRFLARTPAMLLAIQSEDALDEINQPNLPGLSEGPPNWRRRMSEPVESAAASNGVFGKIGALMAREGRSPRATHAMLAAEPPLATYRLQLHAGFTFAQAQPILPYLKALGISHVYASPIQAARKGSTHGYDIVDPREISAELGGADAFHAFADALHAQGLKLIVDIVPNHMGTGVQNPFWMSVLREGRRSPFAHVFDIDWERGCGRLILPVLGKPYGLALKQGEIALAYEGGAGHFVIRHFDHVFPLADATLDVAEDERPDEICALYAREPARLHALLERQHYRLAHWRVAASGINYRRFFEINSLAGVRIEDAEVFELTHRLILDLVGTGKIDGLRIDHIDGLAEPGAYLDRLQRHVGPGFPVWVEKILQRDEELPDWPVAGTTGYDALNELDGVLVDETARAPFEAFYREQVEVRDTYAQALRRAKRDVVTQAFGAEVRALSDVLHARALARLETQDLTQEALSRAIVALVVALPVYRIYGHDKQDRILLEKARADAAGMLSPADRDALVFVAETLLDDNGPARAMFCQLTGPVMAKGLEDTLFYRHAPFLALNEVGGDPAHFGFGVAEFHRAQLHRAGKWPASLLASATHDTKRGEDARARLAALSADPDHVLQRGARFIELLPEIEPRDAWFLFQSLIGAWPVSGAGDLEPRMRTFLKKALREAKLRTSWTDPDEDYEARVIEALSRSLAQDGELPGLVEAVVDHVRWPGVLNGLARTILKLTLPGVPDFYQGTEAWDFSLVDPDNRRPVDFARLEPLLDTHALARPQQLLADWKDGAIKQWLVARILRHRARHVSLFAHGSYEPEEGGALAFTRKQGARQLYVHVLTGTALARAGHLDKSGTLCAASAWHGVKITLAPGEWRNLLTGTAFGVEGATSAAELAEGLPWLILGTTR